MSNIDNIIKEIESDRIDNNNLEKLIEVCRSKLDNRVIKYIKDLKGENFYIPNYQRGYKWQQDDIEALFYDIQNFMQSGEETYCLQPLVVKKLSNNKYEVIDGQQRLTTIYLMLRKLGEEKAFYNIEYQTDARKRKIDEILEHKDEKNITLDDFYIQNAGGVLDELMKKLQQSEKENFLECVKGKVFFIFYVVDTADGKELFEKINIGKIPLTNAELIKALFLCSENIARFYAEEEIKDTSKVEIEQNFMAERWNDIEHQLEDKALWGYLLPKDSEYKTHIDLVFELAALQLQSDFADLLKDKKSKIQQYKSQFEKISKINPKNERFSFLVYNEILKLSPEAKKICNEQGINLYLSGLFKSVSDKFSELKGLFVDDNFYHYVGFLINNSPSKDIVGYLKKLTDKEKGKKEILKAIKKDIFKLAFNIKEDKECTQEKVQEIIDGLTYDDKEICRNVILLHNLATSQENKIRFDFYRYKDKQWDIEHIQAKANETQEGDNSISNLCLLTRDINRAYKAEDFWNKSCYIRAQLDNGEFVPICTQRVFLKSYLADKNPISLTLADEKKTEIKKNATYLFIEDLNKSDIDIDEKIKKFKTWNEEDQKIYANDIITMINKFLSLR